jgi:hypothetical protein
VHAQAGIARKESRGAHSRPHDYPTRDDENYLKHSISPAGRTAGLSLTTVSPHDQVDAPRRGSTSAGRPEDLAYDAQTGDKALREYEFDAPEEATLLDCLDIVKDRHDGSLAYRKSCRMMICGSCGMRMDGAPCSPARCGCTTSRTPATCR